MQICPAVHAGVVSECVFTIFRLQLHAAFPHVLVVGVRVPHPHHRRRAAGHSHRALLQCFRAGQCSGCHALLLSAEHFLQKGEIFLL